MHNHKVMSKTTDKPKKTRGADSTKTRQRILKAARRLFVDRGFNGVSLREIAQQAKVPQSLLHHHFGTKDSLWQKVKGELLDEYYDLIETQADKNKQLNTQKSIAEIITNRFHFMKNHPDLMRISLWQQLDHHKFKFSGRGAELLKRLINFFEEKQDQNDLRNDIDPALLTVLIITLTSSWFQQDYNSILSLNKKGLKIDREKADETYLESIIKILETGIYKSDSTS